MASLGLNELTHWYMFIMTQVRCGLSQVRVLVRPIGLVLAISLLLTLWKMHPKVNSKIFGDIYHTLGSYSSLGSTLHVADTRGSNFEAALAAIAINKTVILAMVDDSQEMSVRNFYQSSILPLGLSNTMFVSTSSTGCDKLWTLNFPCVVYGNAPGGAAVYRQKAFLAKMNVRTNYTLRALELGYSILQTDTDVLYLKNPFPYFDCTACHIEAMQDGISGYINAGFVYIRATNLTVAVYRDMLHKAIHAPTSEDQRNLNNIVRGKKVKYRIVDPHKFVCGKDYYEGGRRQFKSTSKDCPACVAIHNNWIVSTPAKVRLDCRYLYRSLSSKL